MEPLLGDRVKVCGFCSQLTELSECVSLSPPLLSFLAATLQVGLIMLYNLGKIVKFSLFPIEIVGKNMTLHKWKYS